MIEFGIHTHHSYAEARELFPNAKHSREFVSGERKIANTPDLANKIIRVGSEAAEHGFRPWVSFKLNVNEVKAGRWDKQLEEVAQQVPDDYVLIPWHEPEDDMRAVDFAAMFNRVKARVRTAGGTHAFAYSSMAYQWRPGSSTTIDGAAWMEAKADIYTTDAYSGRSHPLDAILPEHDGFNRWLSYVPMDAPWGITERGFITSNQHEERAEQILREADWLVGSTCSVYIYWNTDGTESDSNIVLDEEHGIPALQTLMEAGQSVPEPEEPPVEEPFDEQFRAGFNAGYARGLEDGEAAGYDEGYGNGFTDGYGVAKTDALNAVKEINGG